MNCYDTRLFLYRNIYTRDKIDKLKDIAMSMSQIEDAEILDGKIGMILRINDNEAQFCDQNLNTLCSTIVETWVNSFKTEIIDNIGSHRFEREITSELDNLYLISRLKNDTFMITL